MLANYEQTYLGSGVFKQVLICIHDEVQIIVQLVVIVTFARHMLD